ncbi:MAG: 50S ribosomal protein L10 [Candidatus Daviesbacteria bacterium]|nr:50S ribosomal protein L10 [Candidatus Daviesbacteria bacterium]
MAKTRQQKEETVQIIADKLKKAKAVVFADYKGMTMKQLSDLRDKLREVQGEFTITKNTLLKRALPEADLDGPTATLFAYDDEISPIKILVKALKDAAIGSVKTGFLGKMALDEAKILRLALLPTKDELRGKIVGVLVAPLQGIVSVLQGNLRNLVYVVRELRSVYALNQIKIAKGGV